MRWAAELLDAGLAEARARSTRPRSCSTSTGWAKVARTTWPPTKSTPRLRPATPTSARLATVAMIDRTSARLRQRMKSMLVLSGTSFSSFIGPVPQMLSTRGPLALDPERDQHPGEVDRGEHRGDDADHQHDREAADRAGAEIEHQHGGDDVGDVGVEDRGRGFLVARLERVEHLAAAPLLLADALVDQHVGVDRRADRQHEAGDAGQGQRGVEHRHDAEDHQRVQDQRRSSHRRRTGRR